ncbi:MAG: hypothetical protein GXO99_07145 [Nitrospirae bacterium]|nr:hypothetical protein [Nitrospirota bacterium]
MRHSRGGNGFLGAIIKFILICLPPLFIFFIIWLRSNVVAMEYELGKLQNRKIQLIQDKQELLAKKAQITSAMRVKYVAQNDLGLTYPSRQKVFYVRPSAGVTPYRTGLKSRE